MWKYIQRMFVFSVCALIISGYDQTAAQPEFLSARSVETVVQQLQTSPDVMLVDVREPLAYERVWISGSLNIPLFAVRTKRFLQPKTLILVDEGFHPGRLADACEQLRQEGFTAYFLFGGLNAWQISGNALEGDRYAQQALEMIPAQDVFFEQENPAWILLDISTPDAPHAPSIFSEAVSVVFDPNAPDDFLSRFVRVASPGADHVLPPLVLLYNQDGSGYAQVKQALSHQALRAPVFFLEGGARAYTRVVSQHHSINQGEQDVNTACPQCDR